METRAQKDKIYQRNFKTKCIPRWQKVAWLVSNEMHEMHQAQVLVNFCKQFLRSTWHRYEGSNCYINYIDYKDINRTVTDLNQFVQISEGVMTTVTQILFQK